MIDNPFWDEFAEYACIDPRQTDRTRIEFPLPEGIAPELAAALSDVGGMSLTHPQRFAAVERYGFLMPDPQSLSFVADHAGPRALDPFAQAGYLSYQLEQRGIDVLAYDLPPYRPSPRVDHPTRWTSVRPGHAAYITKRHGEDRSLILCWPYQGSIAYDTVLAYTGDTVIVWADYPSLDDDRLVLYLHYAFDRVATRRPAVWSGLNDFIDVYRRKRRSNGLYWGPTLPKQFQLIQLAQQLQGRLSLGGKMRLLAGLMAPDDTTGEDD